MDRILPFLGPRLTFNLLKDLKCLYLNLLQSYRYDSRTAMQVQLHFLNQLYQVSFHSFP